VAKRKSISLPIILISLILAFVFVRLGIWQLDKARLMQEISKPKSEQSVVQLLSIASPNTPLSNDAVHRLTSFTGRYIDNLTAPNQEDVDGKIGVWIVGVFQVEGSGKILVVRGVEGSSLPLTSATTKVVGRVMPSQINNVFGEVEEKVLTRIDSALLLSDYGSDFFDGYVVARSETPENSLQKVPSPMPQVKVSGFYWQHISYVIIWWLMALLVLAMPFLRNRSADEE